MVLKNTVKHMHQILQGVLHDLQKAEHGNKAASQRVRTGTIRLEKVAKLYRKESIKEERNMKAKAKKTTAKKAPAKKTAKKKTSRK